MVLRAANDPSTSADQIVTINLPREKNKTKNKNEQWPPCFCLELNKCNRAKTRRRINCSKAMHVYWWQEIHAEIKWGNLESFKCWIRPRSPCIPPVNTVPHSGQIETLWGKGRGSELSAESSMDWREAAERPTQCPGNVFGQSLAWCRK